MLTPETIANKTFRRTLLGYDLEQVDDFLDEIILRFQQMERERKEMSDTIEYLAAELRRLSPETGHAREPEEEIALPMSPHEAMERATLKAQPSEEKHTKGTKGEKRRTKKTKSAEKAGAEALKLEEKAEKTTVPEDFKGEDAEISEAPVTAETPAPQDVTEEAPVTEAIPAFQEAKIEDPVPEEVTAEETSVTEEAPAAEETNTEEAPAEEAPEPEAPVIEEASEEEGEQEQKQKQKDAPSLQEAHEDGHEEA